MLTQPQARRLIGELIQEARPEWARIGRFSRYARGRQAPPWLPDDAESEYRDIARKSNAHWGGLVIGATVQGLHVDGYGNSTDVEPTGPWAAWQANKMDGRQGQHHKAIETLGYGYMIALPGQDDMPFVAPAPANKVYAVFDDPWDDWPQVALREVKKDKHYELFDADARYIAKGKGTTAMIEIVEHELPECPVIRFEADPDLLGSPMGTIEPVMSTLDRITDATFTLQMVAKYGAFPQRWIAGMSIGQDEDGNTVPPNIKAYVDHILIAASEETKFGQFEAASLSQYVEALEAHIRHLAATTQTPPHYLLGALVNLSAEALAAAEAGLQRKINDRRLVLGERYEQMFRLLALLMGDETAANDTSAQVHWEDVSSRSLAQAADAILKLKDIVPLEMLLPMVPGFTQTDVDKAIALIRSGDDIAAIMQHLTAMAAPAGANGSG